MAKGKPRKTKEASDFIGVAQITTYREDMHRVQYTQLTLYPDVDLTKEIKKIINRYPEAFTTSVYIKYRPFSEWPHKWREV